MELLSRLVQAGFTEYEAKVYLALLSHYPATGYQISKQAGVPRSMVYEALGRLKGRGAVLETQDRRSSLYRPLPPDVLLDNQERAHRQLLEQLRPGLDQLYRAQDEARMWSVSGRDTVLSYALQMIRQAEAELYLVLDDPDLQVLASAVESAHERGVEINALLTGEAHLTCGRVARHPPLESELQELGGTLIVVADGREALIASGHRQTTATLSSNPHLVLIARQFVWMELLAQRLSAGLGPDLLARLDPEDRAIFESVSAAQLETPRDGGWSREQP